MLNIMFNMHKQQGLVKNNMVSSDCTFMVRLSEMENGRRPIGKERARKLATALNADYRLFL